MAGVRIAHVARSPAGTGAGGIGTRRGDERERHEEQCEQRAGWAQHRTSKG